MKRATLEIAPQPLIEREEKDSFASLYQLYKIDQTGSVASFLRDHPYFTEILFETHRHIKRVFGQHLVEVCLESDRDPEEDFDGLSVIVRTNLSPESSLDLLEKFDEEWWLDLDDEIRTVLTVMVRPI